MWQNTKLLVIASFLIILSGLSFIWFGLTPSAEQVRYPYLRTQARLPDGQASPGVASASTALSPMVWGIEGERAQVTEVIDGDTITVWLQGKEVTIRLVGIDTPETVDPRRPVGCFGKEAANETKKLLRGKKVILQKDVSETDKFQRLLRYIYLPLESGQLLFVNDYLVREGFAKVLTYPPDVKFNEQLREAEEDAKEQNRGLWGKCS